MARPGLDKNVKFRRLCRVLGEPRPHVRGYLECLWDVAYENGDAVIGDAEAVAIACDYPGATDKIVAALLGCGNEGGAGFIEPVPGRAGKYQIHDLFDHAPRYVKLRQARESARAQGKPKADECAHMSAQCAHKTELRAHVVRTPAPAPAPAPAPIPESAAQTSGPRGERSSPTSDHQQAVDHFTAAWAKAHGGAKYPFARGKDAATVKWVLGELGGDLGRWRAVVGAFLADPEPWLVENGHSLATLRTKLPRYVAANGRPPPGEIPSRDPTPADWEYLREGGCLLHPDDLKRMMANDEEDMRLETKYHASRTN